MIVVLNVSDKNTIRDFERIDFYFAGESLHPGLDGDAAGQSGVALEVGNWWVQEEFFVFVVAIGLVVHPLEPVVLKNHPASHADGSLGIVIVGTQMGTIGEVIPVADAVLEGLDLHSVNCFQKGFSNKCRHSLDDAVFVFDIEIDAACR